MKNLTKNQCKQTKNFLAWQTLLVQQPPEHQKSNVSSKIVEVPQLYNIPMEFLSLIAIGVPQICKCPPLFFSVYTSYNPSLPFTMKFPGASFCDGKQKLMMIATLPLSIRKVFLNRVHNILDSMPFIWKKVKKICIFVKILQSFTQEM